MGKNTHMHQFNHNKSMGGGRSDAGLEEVSVVEFQRVGLGAEGEGGGVLRMIFSPSFVSVLRWLVATPVRWPSVHLSSGSL